MGSDGLISKLPRQQRHSLRALWGKDPLLLTIAVALLVALGAATTFHLRHSSVDESVVPGSMSLLRDGDTVFTLDIDDDMQATIGYLGLTMHGRLKLDGGDADTLMYVLKDIELMGDVSDEVMLGAGGSEGEGLDVSYVEAFVRMPRTGTQGDFVGHWALYYRYNPSSFRQGEWCEIYDDGTALVGSNLDFNVIEAAPAMLKEHSVPGVWSRAGDELALADV